MGCKVSMPVIKYPLSDIWLSKTLLANENFKALTFTLFSYFSHNSLGKCITIVNESLHSMGECNTMLSAYTKYMHLG